MIEVIKCPVCNSSKFKKFFLCKDFSSSQEHFKIVSCETCGFKITNPRPKDEELSKYYVSENYISHTNTKKGLTSKFYQLARKIAVKQKTRLLINFSSKKMHLDIGCGTGEFLNSCKKKNFNVIGVEPSELARKQAIKNYGLEVLSDTSLKQFKDNTFDSVSMWHVLEHVSNINETIFQIHRILKNNGHVFIAVPNHESFDANFYKQYWAAWDVPIHLWHFTTKAIKKIFEKSNLKLIKTKGMFFDSFYVSLLSEEYKSGKKNYIKALVIGLISNIIGFISKNGYSSHIYIFKKTKKPF